MLKNFIAAASALFNFFPPMKATPATDRFAHERELWTRGLTRIAGVDEAGRGPLAGPVVAAAVIFPGEWCHSEIHETLRGLNDSKQLTEAQREKYFTGATRPIRARSPLGVPRSRGSGNRSPPGPRKRGTPNGG